MKLPSKADLEKKTLTVIWFIFFAIAAALYFIYLYLSVIYVNLNHT